MSSSGAAMPGWPGAGPDEERPALRADPTPMRPETELAMRRTGMSFQRTRLSADRTLMGVIRTSLALISFGFTIFQVFKRVEASHLVAISSGAARNFGVTLVGLGILMLVVGIVYHAQFMLELRHQRETMIIDGLIHGQSRFPPSYTLITALLLLLFGLLAIISMVFSTGPFG